MDILEPVNYVKYSLILIWLSSIYKLSFPSQSTVLSSSPVHSVVQHSDIWYYLPDLFNCSFQISSSICMFSTYICLVLVIRPVQLFSPDLLLNMCISNTHIYVWYYLPDLIRAENFRMAFIHLMA